jgi:hypothetical protein
VANALPFDHEDHHFGDIGRVIGDPLQIFRDRSDLGGAANGLRVLQHKRQCLAKNLRV